MEYSESTLKKIRKPELIEILEKSGYTVNNKMKVDDLKKMILEKKIKIKITHDALTQEDFENKCCNKNNKSDLEIEEIIEKNQKKLLDSKKIIDLSDPKNKKIKYVIILPYSARIEDSDDANVFIFKFKKDFIGQSEINRFWGIPIFSDYHIDLKLTKYESAIEGFSSIWCNDIPAHLGVCKWDDTPALEFKQYFGISLLCHNEAYLVR